MLTFQILDGGETYYRPLDDRSVTIGSGVDADLRLEGSDVAPIHARVETAAKGEGKRRCRIRCAEGAPPILVNGEEVRESDLVLGDRVEIGGAVLVMGRQVQRPATADDVLVQGGSARRRIPFEHDRRSGQVKRMFAIVAIVGVALCFGLYQWSWSVEDSHLPLVDREQLVQARKRGQFEEARAILDRLEREWVDGDAVKQRLVADHRRLVDDTAAEFDKLHAKLMADVATTSRAKQIEQLGALRHSGTFAEQEAARIMAANLTDLRLAAEERANTGRAQAMAVEIEVAPSTGEDIGETGRRIGPRPDWLDARLEEVRRQLKAASYLEAWQNARHMLTLVPTEHAEPVLDLLADIRSTTRSEMKDLVAKAYSMRQAGQVKEGVALLRDASPRFPAEGELSLLYHVLLNLSHEIGAPLPKRPDVPEPRFKPDRRIVKRTAEAEEARGVATGAAGQAAERDETPAGENAAVARGPVDKSAVERTLAEVDAATKAGDLDRALGLLKEAAGEHGGVRPQLANYLAGEAAKLELIRGLVQAVVAAGDAVKGRSIKLGDGSRGNVVALDGQAIQLDINGGKKAVRWTELGVAGAEAVATAAGLASTQKLGVAALGFLRGEVDAAEAFLAKLVTADTGLMAEVSKLVSRGRDEVVGPEGYELVRGKFVAKRFLRVEKLAQRFARRLGRLAQQTPAQRAALIEKLREDPEPGADDAIVLALRQQLEVHVARLEKSRLPKALGRFASLRAELDKARQHALSLIYDQKQYFYPYKPPAVSGDKYSEYTKVQKDVDARVRAVEKLWKDKTKVPIPPNVRKDTEVLLWIEAQLAGMGEVSDRALARVEWVRALPAVPQITIQNYCVDATECEQYSQWLKIQAFNESLYEELGTASAAQVRVTNAYRLMYRHRPLAVSLKLYEAAQGHAIEMAELGYFSHTSPVEKNKTPYIRMRNAGYMYGISENIAGNPSAEGAHNAWLRSSGHHRNLLNPNHTEFGVGSTGSLWVQNFGRGQDYLEHKRFPK